MASWLWRWADRERAGLDGALGRPGGPGCIEATPQLIKPAQQTQAMGSHSFRNKGIKTMASCWTYKHLL